MPRGGDALLPLPFFISSRVLAQAPIYLASVKLVQQKPLLKLGDLLNAVAQSRHVSLPDTLRDLPQQFSCLPWRRISALRKSNRTAAILGRPRAASSDADGINPCLAGGNETLDAHLVFPAVAEIVLVQKALINAELEIGQSNVSRILGIPGTAHPRYAKFFAVDPKAMEMIVRPGKRNLQSVMEVGERAVGAHQ